ncbi:small-conductance mechanosensitive channel [Catalinimonas alkaloidigena]|uniref:mechanosensitive ion channel family protein n=1 Tax=Catalinimonas alkaloidigena TaxID=1075417 RepID=UPI00240572F7|nr:mechanosensitive ion channel family protein [Catalinimonas alkaloidigena]MDF9800332.1 small-conductance mechanosensitive channel [Catalinimonas alkaloidigena]
MQEFLERTYYDNTVKDYLIVAGLIILGIILVRIINHVIDNRLKKLTQQTDNVIDDYLIESIDRFGVPVLHFIVIYLSIKTLHLSDQVADILRVATLVFVVFFAVRFISTTLLMLLRTYVRKQENGEEKVKQLGGVMLIINIFIWIGGILVLLDNMGIDVTAMIAGLGIGGIAIALAAQNILGDLFNYFVIFFDRPFEIGDFIIIDNKMGVVEYIGIKTTRVKSLSGEQLVFSNSDLTSSRIHNYKRMERRRIVFKVNVIYQTTLEQVKKIPSVLKAAVESQELTQFDRAHFQAYGESSLDFEVVYYILSADYNQYMDVQQEINLRIFEEFQNMGVEFAYPTRTLFVSGQDADADNESAYGKAV